MRDASSQRSSYSPPSTSRSTYLRYDFPFSCWSPLFLQDTLFCVCLQEGDPSVQSAYMPLSLLTSKRAVDLLPPRHIISPRRCSQLTLPIIMTKVPWFVSEPHRVLFLVPAKALWRPRAERPVRRKGEGTRRTRGKQVLVLLRDAKGGMDGWMDGAPSLVRSRPVFSNPLPR